MQLTSWTRLDLVTATIRLSQYQSSPGQAHFEALHKMMLYLRAHPDQGLTYTRKNAIRPLEPHPDCPAPLPLTGLWLPSLCQLSRLIFFYLMRMVLAIR